MYVHYFVLRPAQAPAAESVATVGTFYIHHHVIIPFLKIRLQASLITSGNLIFNHIVVSLLRINFLLRKINHLPYNPWVIAPEPDIHFSNYLDDYFFKPYFFLSSLYISRYIMPYLSIECGRRSLCFILSSSMTSCPYFSSING